MKMFKERFMKKVWIVALVGIMSACVSGGQAVSGIVNLDTAIQQSSKEINDSLSTGTKVAMLNFSSDSDVFSDYVIEEMSIALVKGRKLVVVDRKEIDLIRSEMNFQMSGEVSDESAQKIGMMLGAQSIVSGSLVNMGENYRFRTKAINVISAAIETSSSISVSDDPQIKYLLSQGKKSPAQQTLPAAGTQIIPAQADSSSQPAAPAELRAYKIGDTGPAGGLIFYDKGNNNSGWRYLEAAPVEAEFQAVWSVHRTLVENTQELIGSGRRNTQLIVEIFRQTSGEWDTAAQKADDLVFNGFDDWFLPSKAELDQMYGNLKRRNLGNFKNERYWNSTDRSAYGEASVQDFSDGRMYYSSKNYRYYVRPIRQVPGPAGTARSSADVNSGASGTGGSGKNIGSMLYTLLGVLLLGGIVAFVIWGPTPAGATS
jgi:TolB-like protein